MFRPGSATGSRRGNEDYSSEESESDWDTIAVPSARPKGRGDTVPDVPGRQFYDPPTPRTRISLSEREDMTGDGTPGGTKGEESQQPSLSAGRDAGKMLALTPSLNVSVGESGSRNPSPVPPYTTGFRDALRGGEDINKGEPPSPSRRNDDRGGGRYEPPLPPLPPPASPSPSSRRHIAVDEDTVPNWDDSDAEQQTLHEVHTTFKKEKTREIESARENVQGGGKQDGTAKPSTSVLEKWMQAREEKVKQKPDQEFSRTRKTGMGAVPNELSREGDFAIPDRPNVAYQPFVVKADDGRRMVYIFNEGDTSFYEAEEEDREPSMAAVAEKVEGLIRRGWQEFFGVLRILTSIVVLLIIKAADFAVRHVARPLILALLVTLGDHFLKPVLAALFNAILQPFYVFLWNVLSGLRMALHPLVELVGAILEKVAIVLRAFRLVEVNRGGSGGGGVIGGSGGGGGGQGGLRVVGLGRGARSAESDIEMV